MTSSHQIPILSKQIRVLLGEHTKVQTQINDEKRNLRPNDSLLSVLKKRKLALKDRIQILFSQQPPSQFAPMQPELYVMTNEELRHELTRREHAHSRRADLVGSTSFELVALAAAVRDAALERDRRDLEIMSASDETENLLEVAA